MTSNSEKCEKWDMYTVGSVYGEKIEETGKMRQSYCRKMEYSEHSDKRGKWDSKTLGPGIWQKTEIGGKWDPHTLGTGIWRETVEMWKNVK